MQFPIIPQIPFLLGYSVKFKSFLRLCLSILNNSVRVLNCFIDYTSPATRTFSKRSSSVASPHKRFFSRIFKDSFDSAKTSAAIGLSSVIVHRHWAEKYHMVSHYSVPRTGEKHQWSVVPKVNIALSSAIVIFSNTKHVQ